MGQSTAVRQGTLVFLIMRLFLIIWPAIILLVSPLPDRPDELFRPYLDQPILRDGLAGFLLGPWQRFDTLHYTRIAAQGYAFPADSVFPPLYPLLIRGLGALFGGGHAAHMAGAVMSANLAAWGLCILMFQVGAELLGEQRALRLLIYLVIFPTGFFLFAPYSEPLFLLFALGAIWLAEQKQWGPAGLLGLLAALTRLTGWVLIVPLGYLYWRQFLSRGKWKIDPASWDRRTILSGAAALLPLLGTVSFILYRWAAGLPPLGELYAEYWLQETGLPGRDLWRALPALVREGYGRSREFTLWFDYAVTLLLLITTIRAYFEFRLHWFLYSAAMLFFILLPTSDFKPLYSFSRYALAFFPAFFLMAKTGDSGIIHRLILYPSATLFLYFSGQFFIWGWVA